MPVFANAKYCASRIENRRQYVSEINFMTNYFLLFTAFSLGLLGSPHCAGMCGGIVGILHNGVSDLTGGKMQPLWYGLSFNAGRLLSYAIAGMIAAALGGSLIGLIGMERSHSAMQMIAGAFMLALGLSIAGWWSGLNRVESFGYRIWRQLQPLTRHFIPVHSKFQALLLGTLWGWLPCGLVYTALLLVLASGDPLLGGLTMIAFGLGTLPMLVLLGLSAARINRWRSNARFRSVMGSVIILFGIATFLGIPGLMSHDTGQPDSGAIHQHNH
jgi:sulfite exporter TauE/SafE